MGKTRSIVAGIVAAAAATASAASAQAGEDPAGGAHKSVFHGDYAIVGAGVVVEPEYDGADSSRTIPGLGAMGRIRGIGFTIRGPSLSLNLIPERSGRRVNLRLGPQIRYRGNRASKISDPVVARLGKLDGVIEAGGRIGVSFTDLLSRKDLLSLNLSARRDVSGKGGGTVVVQTVSYMLPVSRGHMVGFQVAAQWNDGDYANYNYAISPAQSVASGLPAFKAKGGINDYSVAMATAHDFDNDFLDGGFAIGAGAMYSRLVGSAAKTPITSIRGNRDQWVFVAGLAYTF